MKNNIKKIIVFCLITLSSLNSIAQTPGSENDIGIGNLEASDTAPISDYIICMLVFAIALSFFLLRKRKTS